MRIRCFINISVIGLVGENYEVANLALCDLELFPPRGRPEPRPRLGVKVRIGTPTVGDTGVESLRLAVQAGEECGLPVMVHIAMGPPSIDDVLELLRPGDIVTHSFTGLSMRLVDDEGTLRDSARRAIERGVLLDIGHGTGSFSYLTAEALFAQGFRPDTISTDMHQLSVSGPMFDLPTTMSKFLLLGMPLADVVRAATSRPAELLGLAREVGTLRPGSHADIGLPAARGRVPALRHRRQRARGAGELLRNTLTLVDGRRLPRREPDPLAPLGSIRSGRPGRSASPRSSGACTSSGTRPTRWPRRTRTGRR